MLLNICISQHYHSNDLIRLANLYRDDTGILQGQLDEEGGTVEEKAGGGGGGGGGGG